MVGGGKKSLKIRAATLYYKTADNHDWQKLPYESFHTPKTNVRNILLGGKGGIAICQEGGQNTLNKGYVWQVKFHCECFCNVYVDEFNSDVVSSRSMIVIQWDVLQAPRGATIPVPGHQAPKKEDQDQAKTVKDDFDVRPSPQDASLR